MRYSVDNWKTSSEIEGKFVHNEIEHEVWMFEVDIKGKNTGCRF
jgi:hypothetical protein